MGDIQQPTSEDLSATAMIQSDSPLIKETAQKIVGGVMTDSIKVTKILNWMYENISKRDSPYNTSALEVLQTKEGDCWEHSVLFCALARAEGIPARVCYGVVYNDGMFSYHAWNKVFVKGKWVAVDPVFYQFPCDATHIKLAEGEGSYMLLMNIYGKLKIKVVEYR
jgi:transglutaminase-like putative cysteine protease